MWVTDDLGRKESRLNKPVSSLRSVQSSKPKSHVKLISKAVVKGGDGGLSEFHDRFATV